MPESITLDEYVGKHGDKRPMRYLNGELIGASQSESKFALDTVISLGNGCYCAVGLNHAPDVVLVEQLRAHVALPTKPEKKAKGVNDAE